MTFLRAFVLNSKRNTFFNILVKGHKIALFFFCFLLRKIIDPTKIRTWSHMIPSQMPFVSFTSYISSYL